MKKAYTKPTLYMETFQLMEHIAGNCIVNDGFAGAHHRNSGDCRYTDDDLVLFYSAGNNCDMGLFRDFTEEEMRNMIINNTVAEELGIECYNSFLATSHLFAS